MAVNLGFNTAERLPRPARIYYDIDGRDVQQGTPVAQ